MTELYQVQKGVPIPETRGRKKGARDKALSWQQAAIRRGVILAKEIGSIAAAARIIQKDYPKDVTIKHLVRLISAEIKNYDKP